jgi:hypothetical protein
VIDANFSSTLRAFFERTSIAGAAFCGTLAHFEFKRCQNRSKVSHAVAKRRRKHVTNVRERERKKTRKKDRQKTSSA